MNAAARLVHRNVLSRHLILSHLLNKQQMVLLFLSMAVLFSAVSIIYVTHVTRIMHANFQQTLTENNKLQVQRSQLLLERSTWLMQAKIQQVAEKQLGMEIPNNKTVVLIHE